MRTSFTVLAAGSILAASAGISGAASAASGASWTKILTPAGPGKPWFTNVNAGSFSKGGGVNSLGPLNISGTTSASVSSGGTGTLDVWCFYDNDGKVTTSSPLNSSPIPITANNQFAGTITGPIAFSPCTLRAVPSGGVTPDSDGEVSDYVAGFAGPVYYMGVRVAETQAASGKVIASEVVSVTPGGLDATLSPGEGAATQGGIGLPLPVDSFGETAPALAPAYFIGFSDANATTGTPTHSGLIVDGLNAYAPAIIDDFASDPTTVPHISWTGSTSAKTGLYTWTESDPLFSCVGDAYPQSKSSKACTPASTGVALTRTAYSTVGGALQVVKDTFHSTDGQTHHVSVEYINALPPSSYGTAGVMLPGETSYRSHPAGFSKALPHGLHTIFTTSDIYATDGTADRADNGLTYTAAASIYYGAPTTFALRFGTHTVKASKPWQLGFAMGIGFDTAKTRSLARAAGGRLIGGLRITAPKNQTKTSKKSIAVKGRISDAANGLPSSVTVTGGSTSVHAAVKSNGTWTVTVPLKNGKHTLTATATDPNGIKLSGSVTVTRKK